MIHKMKLVNFAFTAIKNGNKDIEIRLNDEKRKLINVNDIIEFVNIDTGEEINVRVVNIYRFNTFDELFHYFKHDRFGLKETDDASIMRKFYTKEEEEKYGVVGFEIKLINNSLS